MYLIRYKKKQFGAKFLKVFENWIFKIRPNFMVKNIFNYNFLKFNLRMNDEIVIKCI